MNLPNCPVCGGATTQEMRLVRSGRYYRTVCVNHCLRGEWGGTPHTADLLWVQAVNAHAAGCRRRRAAGGVR